MPLKTFLVAAASGGAFLLPVHAQTLTAPQNAPASQQTRKSGYELLVEAEKKISADGSVYEPMPAEEKLKRERPIVARNAPALALVREAIRAGISVPVAKTYGDTMNFSLNGKTRELARQLALESDVRLADGNFAGALNSKLDALELGVQFGRGPLLTGLVGVAVESIGRTDFGKVAAKLDAPRSRAGAVRLASIEAKRASFAEILRQESKQTQALLLSTLPDVQKQAQTSEGRKELELTPLDAAQIALLTPDKVRSDTAALFAPAIQHAARPYAPSLLLLPPTPDPLLENSRLMLADTNMRFIFERGRTLNSLLRAALELRAQKLESGAYPTQFNAPLDPFSPGAKPLIYKKTATGFSLYSVGPDGKDDGGAEIHTVAINEDTGARTVTSRLTPDSTGDIVQAPF